MKICRLWLRMVSLCFLVLSFTPFAYADITDNFTAGGAGVYSNFNAVSAASLGWNGVSVATVLVQESGNVSTASYSCTGATGISVTLYSALPTYATRGADGVLERARGNGIRYPLQYSAAGDALYLSFGGQAYTGVYDLSSGRYLFTPCDAMPADCVTYGVSVWYHKNGWREATLTLTADSVGAGCFVQRYSAVIPAGTTAVRVLLTEQNQAPVLGRSIRHQMRTTGSLALGGVFIAGATPPGNTLPDTDAGSGGFFSALPENGTGESEEPEEADAYDPYYDAVLPEGQTLDWMQDYRETVTEELRQPQEVIEKLPEAIPETQPDKINKTRESSAPSDEEAQPTPERQAVPVKIDSGSTFWKRADVITAGFILAIGVLAAVRILLREKKR